MQKKNLQKEIIEMSPLLFAIENNQDKIIQLFLSDPSCKLLGKNDINGRSMKVKIDNEIEIFAKTPLYMSIEKQNINAIKLLLARSDININEMSFYHSGNQIEHKAALHLAAKIGNLEIINLLLEKKEIDINIEDDQGKKPIDYSQNSEIKQLLLKQ